MKAVKHKLRPFFPVRTQNYRFTDIKTQINKKNRNTAIQSSLHICCRMKQLPWFAGVCLARKEEMLMDSIAIYRNAVSSALTHRSTMLHVVLPKCAWLHSSLLAIVFVFNHSCKMQLSDWRAKQLEEEERDKLEFHSNKIQPLKRNSSSETSRLCYDIYTSINVKIDDLKFIFTRHKYI